MKMLDPLSDGPRGSDVSMGSNDAWISLEDLCSAWHPPNGGYCVNA